MTKNPYETPPSISPPESGCRGAVIAGVMLSLILLIPVTFLLGYVIGEERCYGRMSQLRTNLIARCLQEHGHRFEDVHVIPAPVGGVCVFGSVASHEELVALKGEIADAMFSDAFAGVGFDVGVKEKRIDSEGE